MTRFVVGFINMLCGDGDRDALRADDYTFSGILAHDLHGVATTLVFGTVISDAAMVDRVIGMDVQEAAAARDRVPRRDRGMGERPRRREIEGIGGRLWYELGQ